MLGRAVLFRCAAAAGHGMRIHAFRGVVAAARARRCGGGCGGLCKRLAPSMWLHQTLWLHMAAGTCKICGVWMRAGGGRGGGGAGAGAAAAASAAPPPKLALYTGCLGLKIPGFLTLLEGPFSNFSRCFKL